METLNSLFHRGSIHPSLTLFHIHPLPTFHIFSSFTTPPSLLFSLQALNSTYTLADSCSQLLSLNSSFHLSEFRMKPISLQSCTLSKRHKLHPIPISLKNKDYRQPFLFQL